MRVPSSDDPIYNPPLEPYISIIHRDEDILVLDKPSGLLSVAGRHPALSDSLATRVQKQFPNALMINRLDKDTSGLVLMSLNRKAHAAVAAQFETRTTQKSYIAEVWGHVEGDSGLIDLPLAIDHENKPRHRVDHENGKPAQTRWQVLERGKHTTRLQLSPLTGRTHQLRVHMKAIGHVILGDAFYAEGAALSASARLMLHAEQLAFRHPDGHNVKFSIPCPF
ncbi:pseudouridine synthase [Ochrobactrum chromiisoli]|uniref:Dual-specificity RNA pseudouridine synthase RluA n=1 Tax=Ochrobactrum chromiisoli TaxID=2993941 RepID=A0ABT3QP62_9HYPH|nr:pseudouridine synthase [Ochrobactrum chromiisoli]MCX2697375.1 pseudouridine synthase [Ochrobactrum chromiisoli]